MKAVYITEFGGPDRLEVKDVDDPPNPSGRGVLVRVKASGLNRADILQRKGFYPGPEGYPERIPGLEFSGVVEDTGPEVRRFERGARVFGITAGGAQAGYLVTPENHLARIPASLGLTVAAAVPEAFITAYDAVFSQAGLQRGETLLVHAVGSGVGLAALQLAKSNGATVIGTSRNSKKLERCKEFGLDVPILAADGSEFSEAVVDATHGKGADVILDLVGAPYLPGNLRSLAPYGRLLLVGLVGGAVGEFDMRFALQKRLKIIGTVLRSRSDQEKEAATKAFEKAVIPLLENRTVKPNVDRVFNIYEIRKAHEYLESNESFGKVVLEIGEH